VAGNNRQLIPDDRFAPGSASAPARPAGWNQCTVLYRTEETFCYKRATACATCCAWSCLRF